MAVRGAVTTGVPDRSTECIVAELAKVSFNSSLQQACLFLIWTDDEYGVISCDCAYDLRPVFIIDSGGDGLSASGCCHQYEQIHGLPNFKAKTFKHLTYSGQGIFVESARRAGSNRQALCSAAIRECREIMLPGSHGTRGLQVFDVVRPGW